MYFQPNSIKSLLKLRTQCNPTTKWADQSDPEPNPSSTTFEESKLPITAHQQLQPQDKKLPAKRSSSTAGAMKRKPNQKIS